MSFITQHQKIIYSLIAIAVFVAVPAFNPLSVEASALASTSSALGTIKGVVRDQRDTPIPDATVAIFRVGTSKLLKQVRSASDGSFVARIMPGKYTVLAVAQGYNPVAIDEMELERSAEISYGFKLERAGSGNTLPEKRLDRDNPKWIIRSAQTSRVIYQNSEGMTPVVGHENEDAVAFADRPPVEKSRSGQSVVETYFGSSPSGVFNGINYATLIPVGDNAEVILAAQAGIGENAPQSIETQIKFRPSASHQLRFRTSFGTIGSIRLGNSDSSLGQFSVQALDEWRVREGVIVVYGLDYSSLTGAGDDTSFTPRLGLQFDLDARTRFRAAYTTQTDERTWANAIELEGSQVTFREPAAIEDFVVENGKPQMNKSRRLEFGIERVLDNKSSIESTVFFDSFGRGAGFLASDFDSASAAVTETVGEQQGNAQGFRVVYSRRLNSLFSTAAGYSFGAGQQISPTAFSDTGEFFQNDTFHTFFGKFEADLGTGTSVRTIFRLSPRATVFAVDPFRGRLAIYDPSLSVLVTQNLPNLGLPFQAEATVDARNLFDVQTGVVGEGGVLRMNSQRRMLRGGILVRF